MIKYIEYFYIRRIFYKNRGINMDNEKQFYYANIATIESSNYDMKINFGRFKEAKEGEKIDINKNMEVEICMSPQHAKVLAHMLMQNVQQYERMFGEICIQPKENVK